MDGQLRESSPKKCESCPRKLKKIEPKRFIVELANPEFHAEVKAHALKQGHRNYREWIMAAIIKLMAEQKAAVLQGQDHR